MEGKGGEEEEWHPSQLHQCQHMLALPTVISPHGHRLREQPSPLFMVTAIWCSIIPQILSAKGVGDGVKNAGVITAIAKEAEGLMVDDVSPVVSIETASA